MADAASRFNGYIGVIQRLYGDDGKENGTYYLLGETPIVLVLHAAALFDEIWSWLLKGGPTRLQKCPRPTEQEVLQFEARVLCRELQAWARAWAKSALVCPALSSVSPPNEY